MRGSVACNHHKRGQSPGYGAERGHEFQYICSTVKVRAQISRHLVLLMCVALSQAAMHSGMFLPDAPPPISDEPPLVAMTSPVVPTIAAVGGSIAALTGAWGTAPLVVVFGKIRL